MRLTTLVIRNILRRPARSGLTVAGVAVAVAAVLLALAGAAVGTLLAVGLTQVLSRLPEAGRLVSGDIAPEVVLQGFVLALLLGVVGGIFPAFRAIRTVPTEGLRHE